MREFFREIVHALEEGRPVELVSIAASDGTTLKMSVLTNGPRRSAEDLTDAVFKASAPKKGTFAGVRYVERTNTRGGMPLTKCSASQQGQRLSRPFEADYTFWR